VAVNKSFVFVDGTGCVFFAKRDASEDTWALHLFKRGHWEYKRPMGEVEVCFRDSVKLSEGIAQSYHDSDAA